MKRLCDRADCERVCACTAQDGEKKQVENVRRRNSCYTMWIQPVRHFSPVVRVTGYNILGRDERNCYGILPLTVRVCFISTIAAVI